MIEHISSKQQFTSALQNSSDMIVLDFFDDCTHCTDMNDKLDEYSSLYENQSKKVKFYKCNIEKDMELASDYSVNLIPTTLFFKKGKLIDKVVGPDPSSIKSVIDSGI
ncbi:conserved hypothetical protein [Lodderomyces elongisporus NRRL YB-4239]|uniref:Thioredoxin domain-containing protein n=1 Tax=Lodderomyces elongisporus (strain ATCC 11503 / CBS 2605 / JCM 1781 / NBRC 1676 / NRRL YB-4239) TaxID=379508 RepID=A5E3D3_LODEL|nr:conserved hypothetical protein [Lodderomyces elongisporus NRRL YB-4239]